MIIKRIRSEIVAHLSYFIGSDYEALVVDPRRDPQAYLDIAKRENMNIRYVFETHRNEDYVIGSRELADLTGAEIYHGPWPDFQYGKTLRDGQEFEVGSLKILAIHTPGHTPGCVSYAVSDLDSGDETVLVCTGDALFVNEVGRTDFGGPNKRREWAENLYNSIFSKLLPLGDHVMLCPAHGAGSVCGAGIADREWSTLGLERLMNPVLQKSKEDFLDYKVREHHEYAPYFTMMEKCNVEGAPFVNSRPIAKALSAKKLREMINEKAVVLDTRSFVAFGGAHVEGSYSIPASALSFAGWFLPYDRPIVLVADEDIDYVTSSLSYIGYDNLKGYLANGFRSWLNSGYRVESSGLMDVATLKARLDSGEKMTLLDVRSNQEWDDGHLEGATHIYAGLLEKRLEDVPRGTPIVVICGTGRRASVAVSILLRDGRDGVHNLLGGMTAWGEARYPVHGQVKRRLISAF